MLKRNLNVLLSVSLLALAGCGGGGSGSPSGGNANPGGSPTGGSTPQGNRAAAGSAEEGFWKGYTKEEDDLARKHFPISSTRALSLAQYLSSEGGAPGDDANFIRINAEEAKANQNIGNTTIKGVFADVQGNANLTFDSAHKDTPAFKMYALTVDGKKEKENIEAASINTNGRAIQANNIYVGPFAKVTAPISYIDKDGLVSDLKNITDPKALNAGVVKIGGSDKKTENGKIVPGDNTFAPSYNAVFTANKDDGIFYFASESDVKGGVTLGAHTAYLNGKIDHLTSNGATLVVGREDYATAEKFTLTGDSKLQLDVAFWDIPNKDGSSQNLPLLLAKEFEANGKLELTLGGISASLPERENTFNYELLRWDSVSGSAKDAVLKSTDPLKFLHKERVYTLTPQQESTKIIASVTSVPKADDSSAKALPTIPALDYAKRLEEAQKSLVGELQLRMDHLISASLSNTVKTIAQPKMLSKANFTDHATGTMSTTVGAKFNVGFADVMAIGHSSSSTKSSGFGSTLLVAKTMNNESGALSFYAGTHASSSQAKLEKSTAKLSLSEQRLDLFAGIALKSSNYFVGGIISGKLGSTNDFKSSVRGAKWETPAFHAGLEAAFNLKDGSQASASLSTFGTKVGYRFSF